MENTDTSTPTPQPSEKERLIQIIKELFFFIKMSSKDDRFPDWYRSMCLRELLLFEQEVKDIEITKPKYRTTN